MTEHAVADLFDPAEIPTPGGVPDELAGLLRHGALWRAGHLERPRPAISTGFDELDVHLAGGGWPRAGLTELLPDTLGIGELRLLVPALRRLSCTELRWVAWLNPPAMPYAPALEALGVDVDKILLIHPKNHREAVWALEQAARSGSCSALLAWLDESRLKDRDTRRLQLAARQGHSSLFLFRPPSAARRSSMAELRLTVATGDGADVRATDPGLARVTVTLLKRRGGWPVHDLSLDLGMSPISFPSEAVRAQLSLWRRARRPPRAEPERDVQRPTPVVLRS